MGNLYRFSVDISAENTRVTGSLLQVCVHRVEGDVHFLVDCGIYYPEKKDDVDSKFNENYNEFGFNPEKIDFVLLTHVHADHCGRIPLLYKRGFYKEVICSVDTAHMLSYALTDSAKVMAINAKRNEQKPLYGMEDVESSIDGVNSKEFGETFEPCKGVKVTFFKNAHLIGAATILVQVMSEGREDINLLFIGDYHKRNIFFDVPDIPRWVRKLPIHIITESTYGSVDSKDTDRPVFCDNIRKWLEAGKEKIIIPSLSLGRFQQLAYILKEMQKHNTLDVNIPIWFDGNLAIKYCIAFKDYLHISSKMKEFMPLNSRFVEDKAAVISSSGPKIIVASSGNANYGPVTDYISAYVEDPKAAIHFTSFLIPGCLGSRLLQAEHGEKVNVYSVMQRKLAEVKTTPEFSGHAKRDQIMEFLMEFQNIRSLMITHGEPETKESFADYCSEGLSVRDVAILGMGYTMRVDTYGITKRVRQKEFPTI